MTGTEPRAGVLVVGGGLVGLAAATFLAWHGVSVTVLERHAAPLRHPRARSINPRTAELLRQVGLASAVADGDGYVSELPSVHLIRARTLAGEELGRTEQRPPAAAAGDRVSPASWGMIDQDRLEAVLCRRARELGADIRFGHEFVDLSQDDAGVLAQVRGPDGAGYELAAHYLVGADGHGSVVRQRLGVGRSGPGMLSHVASLVFDADLSGPLRGRHDPAANRFIASCHLTVPHEGTVLFPHGQPDRWVFNVPFFPERGERVADYDDARCVAAVRAAVGVPDLPVSLVPQLPDGTRVLGYEIGALVAERFRVGRTFLAGDAAHLMPPTGAFGAGTGVQDVHNLAWKLAEVLAGRAGTALLDSYEAERRPIAEFTCGQALLLMSQRAGASTPVPDGHRPVEYDAVVFGYRYRSPVVLAGPDHGPPALPPEELTAQPGTRAPHFPVGAGSSLDRYGRRHVLLAGPRWPAEPVGDDVPVHRLDDPELLALHGITDAGAVLVRPDGFVAWRCPAPGRPDGGPASAATALERVRCRERITAPA